MTAARRRAPRLLGVLAVVGLGAATAALALAPAGSASAHDYVVSSSPSAGSTVDAAPATVSITFNDVILDLSGTGSSNVLEVTDASGLHYEDGCSTTSGPTLTTGVALGAAGDYTMTYQAVSADGHTVSDAVPFTYAPAAGATEASGSATRPACDGTAGSGGAGGATEAPTADETDAASPSASPEPEMTTLATPGDDSGATSAAAPESGSVNAGLVIGIAVAIVVLAAAGVAIAIVTGRRRDASPAEDESDADADTDTDEASRSGGSTGRP